MIFQSDFDTVAFCKDFEKLAKQKNPNIVINYHGDQMPEPVDIKKAFMLDLQEQYFLARYIESDIEFLVRHVYAEFFKCLSGYLNIKEDAYYSVNMHKWKITYDDAENAYLYTAFVALNVKSINHPAIYKD